MRIRLRHLIPSSSQSLTVRPIIFRTTCSLTWGREQNRPPGTQEKELVRVLFNTFIDVLDEEIKGTLSTSTDDTKLGGNVDLLEGRRALQRDLDKLDPWVKANCQVLPLDHNNFRQRYRLRIEWLKNCPVKKDLQVLFDNQLAKHQPVWSQVAKKTNGILDCIKNSVASRTRAVIVPLNLCAPQILCSVLNPSGQDVEMLECVQRRAMNLWFRE
ncbi:hypothetical protein DUI87_16989 [Hirundo rustica rustica]|uniref:Rna-directed dna polymerase from mobile element jockey-like n=1 Tax=Hirundo rustica rustica TaxID=333673 RepID=A0A3M0K2P2_HIRRU|nr:hypothetical protein DUI87_16989 [Hirundo rustica rustica]